jgi:DNA mismatch repair ATPase MutL
VPALFDDVCLSCFKIHLKGKVEDVDAMFKSLKKHDTGAYEESADLRARIERAYAEVFPDKKNVAPASPVALAELIKEALRDYSTDDGGGIVNMEEDLDAMEDDEEEDDDEDEEDDSIVESDDVVRFDSDASSSSSSDDEEAEAGRYESKRNSNKKRERKEESDNDLTVRAVAHRILLARHRTPIESRLNELYELHFKAAAAPASGADQEKLLTAADVKLAELEQLTRVYCIVTTYNNKQHQHPFFFFTEEEAEGKLALLEKMTSGLTGRVEEKKLE